MRPPRTSSSSPGRENLVTAAAHFHSWRDDALFSLDLEGHIIGSALDAQGDSSFCRDPHFASIGATPTITKERGAYKDPGRRRPLADARGRQPSTSIRQPKSGSASLTTCSCPMAASMAACNAMPSTTSSRRTRGSTPATTPGADALRGTLHHTNRALELYGGLGASSRETWPSMPRPGPSPTATSGTGSTRPASTAPGSGSAWPDTLTVASVIGETAYRGRGPSNSKPASNSTPTEPETNPTPGTSPAPEFSAPPDGTSTDCSSSKRAWRSSALGMRRPAPLCPQWQEREKTLQTGARSARQPRVRRRRPHLRPETAGLHGSGPRHRVPLQCGWRLGLDASGPLGDTQIFNGYNAQRFRVMMWAGYRF